MRAACLWIAFVLINNAWADCAARLPISIIPPDTLTTVSHHARPDEFCLFAASHSKTQLDKQTDKGAGGLVDHILSHFPSDNKVGQLLRKREILRFWFCKEVTEPNIHSKIS